MLTFQHQVIIDPRSRQVIIIIITPIIINILIMLIINDKMKHRKPICLQDIPSHILPFLSNDLSHDIIQDVSRVFPFLGKIIEDETIASQIADGYMDPVTYHVFSSLSSSFSLSTNMLSTNTHHMANQAKKSTSSRVSTSK
jgi:hypothetical protein